MDLEKQMEIQRKRAGSALQTLLGYAGELVTGDLESNSETLEQLKGFSPNMAGFFCVEGVEQDCDDRIKEKYVQPIYEILNCHGLNQMIGYVKLINKEYGKVFYRGQCNLYSTMLPSLYHKSNNAKYMSERNQKLNSIINKTLADKVFMKEANLSGDMDEASIIIEGMLQHYGIETRCIDAVDNHWVALWFGVNKYHSERISDNVYASYTNIIKNAYQIYENERKSGEKESYFQYVILIAADKGKESFGVVFGNDMLTVDLRVALPSTFLRPHAQHGIVLK